MWSLLWNGNKVLSLRILLLWTRCLFPPKSIYWNSGPPKWWYLQVGLSGGNLGLEEIMRVEPSWWYECPYEKNRTHGIQKRPCEDITRQRVFTKNPTRLAPWSQTAGLPDFKCLLFNPPSLWQFVIKSSPNWLMCLYRLFTYDWLMLFSKAVLSIFF